MHPNRPDWYSPNGTDDSAQRGFPSETFQNVVVRPTRNVRGKPGEMFVLLSALR